LDIIHSIKLPFSAILKGFVLPLSNFELDDMKMIHDLINSQREETDNTTGFVRDIPHDDLLSLTSVIPKVIAQLNKHHFDDDDFVLLSKRLCEEKIPTTLNKKLSLVEAKNSNLIENIICIKSDEILSEKYLSINNTPININEICLLQQNVDIDKYGIRDESDAKKITRIMNGGKCVYTPPRGKETLDNMLNDWVCFNNKTKDIKPSIALALSHYQFESIHPFYDMNGRVGQLFRDITGFKGVVLFSEAINDTRACYYRALNAPRLRDNYNELCEYFSNVFVEGIINTLQFIEANK